MTFGLPLLKGSGNIYKTMIKAMNKESKLVYRLIQWTGNNSINVKQFGSTGGRGNKINVTCGGACRVHTTNGWKRALVGDWILLSYTRTIPHFKIVTKNEFEKYWEIVETNNV